MLFAWSCRYYAFFRLFFCCCYCSTLNSGLKFCSKTMLMRWISVDREIHDCVYFNHFPFRLFSRSILSYECRNYYYTDIAMISIAYGGVYASQKSHGPPQSERVCGEYLYRFNRSSSAFCWGLILIRKLFFGRCILCTCLLLVILVFIIIIFIYAYLSIVISTIRIHIQKYSINLMWMIWLFNMCVLCCLFSCDCRMRCVIFCYFVCIIAIKKM